MILKTVIMTLYHYYATHNLSTANVKQPASRSSAGLVCYPFVGVAVTAAPHVGYGVLPVPSHRQRHKPETDPGWCKTTLEGCTFGV